MLYDFIQRGIFDYQQFPSSFITFNEEHLIIRTGKCLPEFCFWAMSYPIGLIIPLSEVGKLGMNARPLFERSGSAKFQYGEVLDFKIRDTTYECIYCVI